MNRAIYIRNIVFGVEDSLVSTVGLLSGIDLGHVPVATILFTGIVYIFVEAFSMAIGSYLSEESVEEYEKGNGTMAKASGAPAAIGGVIMFVSFVIAGFIPLAPYLFVSGYAALIVSIVISLVCLGILGYESAVYTKVAPWKRTFRMLVLGGSAIVIGAVVSLFVKMV